MMVTPAELDAIALILIEVELARYDGSHVDHAEIRERAFRRWQRVRPVVLALWDESDAPAGRVRAHAH